jgi:hypothetical protein
VVLDASPVSGHVVIRLNKKKESQGARMAFYGFFSICNISASQCSAFAICRLTSRAIG